MSGIFLYLCNQYETNRICSNDDTEFAMVDGCATHLGIMDVRGVCQ